MNNMLVLGIPIGGVALAMICWLGWQLLRQNGRLLLRLETIEQRLEELEFGDAEQQEADGNSQPSSLNSQPSDDRVSRFGSRSLARSKIARNGLKAGTLAPPFRLPRVDGGDLALQDLRGSRVLLVFSDPHCGPCDALAPRLDQMHQEHPEIRLVMISRGEARENRAKVREHRLTFPVVLQPHWEISRRYAMFATPIAYLINEAGVITRDVAVGEDAILNLISFGRQ